MPVKAHNQTRISQISADSFTEQGHDGLKIALFRVNGDSIAVA